MLKTSEDVAFQKRDREKEGKWVERREGRKKERKEEGRDP